MRWDRQIEVADYRKKVFLSVSDILGFLQENLSKNELEEFAAEIVKWCELSEVSLLD